MKMNVQCDSKRQFLIFKFIRNDIRSKGSGERPYHGGRLYDTDRIWLAISDCISVIKTVNETVSFIEIESQGYSGLTKSILEDSSILSHVKRAF